MIRFVHSRILIFYPSPIPGPKATGSRIRIRNTASKRSTLIGPFVAFGPTQLRPQLTKASLYAPLPRPSARRNKKEVRGGRHSGCVS